MKENLTDDFIKEIYILSRIPLSKDLTHQVKRCLLDYLGVTFAGSEMLKNKGEKLLDVLGNGTEDATVVGFDKRINLERAILLNGLSAHIAELDDGIRFGMLHPGSPIISAILSVAQFRNVSAENLFRGIMIGYETAIRLACAIQPSHYNKGFHPTATCGGTGVAVGIAAMLEFSQEEMKDAFSSAVISSSGTLKVIEDTSEIKPFNVGRSAVIGYMSAMMAQACFKGPNDVLTGNSGFLSMMAENYNKSELLKGTLTSDLFGIQRIYVKPYAACRHAHPSIEASIAIKEENNLKIDSIKDIKVTTYESVLGKHDHSDIHGVSSAKMSIPFSIAISLILGKAGINEFSSKYIEDTKVLSIAKKVKIYGSSELTQLVPQRRIAIVDISTYDGDKYLKRIDFPKGEPENPLSDAELKNKFLDLMSFAKKSKEKGEKIIDTVFNLENRLQDLYPLL